MDTDLVYNPVRAMIRTVNPREGKLLEDEQKFKKKVRVVAGDLHGHVMIM